jgi:glucose-6-phosphate isomerase
MQIKPTLEFKISNANKKKLSEILTQLNPKFSPNKAFTYADLKRTYEAQAINPSDPTLIEQLKQISSVFSNFIRTAFLTAYRPGFDNAQRMQTLFFAGKNLNQDFNNRLRKSQGRFIEIKQKLQPSYKGNKARLEYFDWLNFKDNGPIRKGLEESKQMAEKVKQLGDKKVFVMGMGGSSMCGKLINSALPSAEEAPDIQIMDNMDPATLLEKLPKKPNDLISTTFVIVSKSGNTFEVSHVIEAILAQLQAAGLKQDEALKHFAKHVVFITEPKEYTYNNSKGQRNGKNKGTLNKLIAELEAKTGVKPKVIDHPPRIGGRYSLFSPVGLFVGALKGINVEDFVMGAKFCVEEFFQAQELTDCPAAKYALLDMLCAQKGFKARYVMPYDDSISALPEFSGQLAGESSNKNDVAALVQKSGRGPTAHHSDVEGLCRNDKDGKLLFEEILVKNPRQDFITGASGLETLQDQQLKSLHTESLTKLALPFGRHLNERMRNPMITTVLDKVDEFNLGYLAMRYMLSTVIQAGFQPTEGKVKVGVGEQAKEIARTLEVNLLRAVYQDQVETMKIQKANDAKDLDLESTMLANRYTLTG